MARRRKYKKRKRESIWEKYDWSTNPETMREIGAVIFFILGLVFLLSIFGIAGTAGIFIAKYLDYLFGIIGYFLPFIFLLLGYMLWFPKKFELKPISWFGGIFALIFIPALISPFGGIIGQGISDALSGAIGALGSFIILLGLSIIFLLMLFNTSIRKLYVSLVGEEQKINENQPQPARVSVFAMLKNKFNAKGNQNFSQNQTQIAPITNPQNAKDANKDWEFPPMDLLDLSNAKATSGNIAKNVETIQKTLKDFNINVAMGDVNIGPTVTQYTMKPSEGVKLAQIVARTNDLALALAAHPIRIEAPIPGKSAVGVEVPNKIPAIVTIREILESAEFKSSKSNLTIALGRDVAGKPIAIDLERMPHLLIAGATGSGKSICINGIIASLLYQNSPQDLRVILVDPKRVEFTPYNGIGHLLSQVVVEPDKTVNVLKWAVAEMERRFQILSNQGRRDITAYNKSPGPEGKMPYIVIIIDELADLMAKSANDVEAAIVRIAQMARAVGIHLVVATQRPSVNVITGLIKANITSRIAFAVASQIDSRTIIDVSGAEKLLGKGDMLYLSSDFGKPLRVQGVMISDKEIRAVTNFLKKNGYAQYDQSIENYKTAVVGSKGGGREIDDEMYEDAKQTVIDAGRASASLLQRRLRVGYARAARLLDILEDQGIIGPAEGAKPRKILSNNNTKTIGSFAPDDPRLDSHQFGKPKPNQNNQFR